MEKILHEGIVLVDKPTGVTSHAVVNWSRKLSGIKKVGHTGTLDPLATGLLILLIGRKFTKQQDQYLQQNKTYLCTAKIGLTTDTYDINGEVLNKKNWEDIQKITKNDVQKLIPEFTGSINQRVPIFSAVRQDGRKLYKLARAAKNDPELKKKVDELLKNLPSRDITIHNLELNDFVINNKTKEVLIKFTVTCSSGTYIRSLAHDIGQRLSVGATVVALRRIKIGDISIDQVKICPFFLFKNYYSQQSNIH